MDADGYRDLAVATLHELLAVEHAVVWSEVEARMSDRRWGPNAVRIDPHHLTTAKRWMTSDGSLVTTSEAARGGRFIETHSLAGAPKRSVQSAAARKRLLHARFMGWAKGTRRHPRGLLGGAGETVSHASLVAAAASGYRLVPRSGGDVAELFGAPVLGGSLDDAAHLLLMDEDAPSGHVTILVEVKNIREWLYPSSAEIYQLLTKASLTQEAHSERSFVPVLVCRRAHKTLFRMAKAFGFYVIDSRRQFITPTADISDEALTEVRHGLGFVDLASQNTADDLIERHFATYLPREAATFASRWKVTSDLLGYWFPILRNPGMPPFERATYMDELRRAATELPEGSSGW